MDDLLQHITTKPGLCGGRPTIRGMRIRVSDVLDLLAIGLTFKEIIEEELPDLNENDIEACLKYASLKIEYSVIHATV